VTPDAAQCGVAPPQSASPAQARQARLAESQTGVWPPQSASERQPTQVSSGAHRGEAAGQSASITQRTHWPAIGPDVAHWGVAPGHSEPAAQARQVWLPGSQIGVAPPQSASDTQPTQSCRAPSQTGVGVEQSPADKHWTQRLATVSHLGVAGLLQSESTWQTTQAPAFIPVVMHAGPPGFPMQSALFWQARQVWVVVAHVGVWPLQSELNSQATQVPVG